MRLRLLYQPPGSAQTRPTPWENRKNRVAAALGLQNCRPCYDFFFFAFFFGEAFFAAARERRFLVRFML
jgi:hypothetical protein